MKNRRFGMLITLLSTIAVLSGCFPMHHHGSQGNDGQGHENNGHH
jgi:hypothetical protein